MQHAADFLWKIPYISVTQSTNPGNFKRRSWGNDQITLAIIRHGEQHYNERLQLR